MVTVVSSVALFLDESVRFHQTQVLGYAWSRKPKRLSECIDIFFTMLHFLNQADPIRMRKNLEDLGQFLRHNLSTRHRPAPFRVSRRMCRTGIAVHKPLLDAYMN